jgi:hypothetical protein
MPDVTRQSLFQSFQSFNSCASFKTFKGGFPFKTSTFEICLKFARDRAPLLALDVRG